MQTPKVTIIAAVAKNGVIGKDNRLPWHLPADLKRFKTLTTGHAIIMGRKTWQSLPGLLPNRRHIVITRHPEHLSTTTGIEVVSGIREALAVCQDENEVFVIGGAEIYRSALVNADQLELTEIKREFEGDVRFPQFDSNDWVETARTSLVAESGLAFDFVTYCRKRSQ